VLRLERGAAQPFELTVIATPNDCAGFLTLSMAWSRRHNRVVIELDGPPGSLLPKPSVHRTPGVNYEPNAFFPESADIVNGRYQLWLVGAGGPLLDFHYSGETLDLLGSEVDFPDDPPAESIAVPFPTLFMVSTPMFQPRRDGSVQLHWSFPYHSAHRGDRPELSHHVLTFTPPNLCGANPNALHLSTLRPYLSAPRPRAEARPWSDYLRGGMLFDVTVEPREYPQEPPMSTLIGSYSGATGVGSNVPRGYTFDVPGAIAGVAPPIRPWAGANGCFDHYAPLHTSNINFCQQ
jgi:hypothetical protein